jgi:hypothetical protein
MSSAANYRALASNCDARASKEIDPHARFEWERMASGYRLLAEQADRNARYEQPTQQVQQQQAQQQQQPQSKAEKE